MIRIGERPTAADRYETTVAVLREDHTQHSFRSHQPNVQHDAARQSLRASFLEPSHVDYQHIKQQGP